MVIFLIQCNFSDFSNTHVFLLNFYFCFFSNLEFLLIILESIPIQMSHTNPLCLRPLVLEITRYKSARKSNIELGVPVVPLPCLMEVNNLKTLTKFPV